MIPRSVVALAMSLAVFAGVAGRFRTNRSATLAVLLLAAVCFVGVAIMHVFEAFGILAAAGWGQPNSVGHYIDLATTVLGSASLLVGLLLFYVRRRTA